MKQKRRAWAGLLWLLPCVLLTGCAGTGIPALTGLPVLRTEAGNSLIEAEELPPETEKEQAEICVYVCGSVRSPGIVYLSEGSRLMDAVEAAGGFRDDARPEACNLAQKLMDGEQILVPSRAELQAEGAVQGTAVFVNLNTAGREELMTLPGIGEVRAEAILRSRKEEGPFRTIEEITRVSGIGKAAFEKIKAQIRV